MPLKENEMLIKEINPYFELEDISILIRNINNHFDKIYELGESSENGTEKRIEIVTKQSIELFEKVFEDKDENIVLAIFEFPDPNPFQASNSYLYTQIKEFSNIRKIEKKGFNINILDLKLKDINYKNILKSIANTEMGFEPALSQIIYFFSNVSPKAFGMLDDRSCKINGI